MSDTNQNNNLPKVVVILGPTGSGKSQLAIELAKKFNGEIVSADSRQLYKGMDIGTGKVTATERKQVKHYLLDIAEPDHQIYLPQYQTLAFESINKILKNKKLPLVVGGTGLYLSAIAENYQIPNVPPNPALRAELEAMSTDDLVLRLKKQDPEAAQLIYQNNKVKLIRAIEFNEMSGQRFFQSQKTDRPKHNYLLLGIDIEREELYEKINRRVDEMIKQGLENEVSELVKKFGWDAPGMLSIGYREWQEYFVKQRSLADVIEEIKKDTRNYAKRQMTWFWRMERSSKINWITNSREAVDLISDFLLP